MRSSPNRSASVAWRPCICARREDMRMTKPRFARFFKADLQMQTPVDRQHWLGDRLPADPSEQELAAAAEAYARRCYEVGLEIIGITDHNMGGGAATSFVPHLEVAIKRLASQFGYEIVVFPGFEFSGPIGRGCHMLCLFEPGTAPQQVSEKLTRMGLAEGARSSDAARVSQEDCSFGDILRIVQEDDPIPGLCILAHVTSDGGAMHPGTISQDWSQELIRNEKLLCMELPRPRDGIMSQERDSLVKSVLLNKDARYKRRHPIATICSSDTKRLEPDEESRNHIGYRHTWIKMSKPSIEALRQAFLDHDSRIRFGEQRPEDGLVHPRIARVAVSSAGFLDDQEIRLPPSMTTLIGGGGTGKSTIIEYVRAALGQADAIHDDDVQRNHLRVMRTVRPETRIEVDIERDGRSWTLRSKAGRLAEAVGDDPIPDLPRFFPLRVYGQREIYAIAEDRRARARLVDNLVRKELEALASEANELTAEIRILDEEILRQPELEQRRAALEAERLGLETRLRRLRELDEPLREWKGALAEQQFLQRAREEITEIARWQGDRLDEFDLASTTLGADTNAWPHSDDARALAAQLDDLVARTQAAIRQQLNDMVEEATAMLDGSGPAGWQRDFVASKASYEELRERLGLEGADPDAYLEQERELKRVIDELALLAERIDGIAARRRQRSERLAALLDVWSRETEVRQRKAEQLGKQVPRTAGGEGPPFVEVDVEAYGDQRSFFEAMEEVFADRRRISSDDWLDLLQQAVDRAPDRTPPTCTLIAWVRSLRDGSVPEDFPWTDERRRSVLLDWLDEATCARIELLRVPDRVAVRLNRHDGSAAGDLEEGLSVGQRCTAILALLLADDDAPVLLDQPEDEIDNEFIYRELVPMLRRVKDDRQIVIATHDPNLPVNGDAELIHALEARDGRGRIKEVEGDRAVGALDRASVRRAVEDIMEGSEEAFRRRYAKYGF